MTGLIFDLPDVLVLDLLKEWVDIRDVGKLDSAMCQKSTRENYIGFVKHENCIIESIPDQIHKSNTTAGLFVAWVMKRKIPVKELVATDLFRNNVDDRTAYLVLQGKYVCKVTFPKGFCSLSEKWDGVSKRNRAGLLGTGPGDYAGSHRCGMAKPEAPHHRMPAR